MVPTYRVSHYEITGSSVLDQAAVDRLTRSAVGEAVSIAHLRRGLTKIQEAYRNLGYDRVAVTLPQQPLTNGIVKVRVNEGPSSRNPVPVPETPAAPVLAEWSVPTFDIHHFDVRGNQALMPEEIDRMLRPVTGLAVNLDQLQKSVDQLQTLYRARGYPDATVSLPQQVLLPDGTVTIDVQEGLSQTQIAAQRAARETPVTNAPVPERTFEVKHFDVAGNTLLRPLVVEQAFTNAIGPAVTFKQIQQAMGNLQLAYRERGFASVSVSLPPQQLTNAIVKVRVVEGVLAEINVKGNRYFSFNNVMRTLPSLKTNEVLNSRIFQRELDIANQNRDRQIYPVLGPGPEPGTSELTLKVKDRLPLHGRMDFNNYNTPGTPDWRLNSSVQYNNLWQREHQLGLSYGFTPQNYRGDGFADDYVLNRPLVANGGVFYRLPFGSARSVTKQINSSATRFGYDEATRQFRLPPAGARPDLTIYGSASSSDTDVQYGPTSFVTPETNNPTLTTQDSGQNLTINRALGGRLNIPWVLSDARRFNFSGGLDWKQYKLTSYNTNNYTSTYKFYDSTLGDQVIVRQTHIGQATIHNDIDYLPFFLGVDFFGTDKRGSTYVSLGVSANFIGNTHNYYTGLPLGSSPTNYPSANTHLEDYGKFNLSLVRDLKLAGGWSLNLRADGQAATGSLISNEQFALGGMNSVRGYFEGDESGDAGWSGSLEFRTPYINSTVPVGKESKPVSLRGAVFLDGGQRWLLDNNTTSPSLSGLIGTGLGISANINNHLDARLTVGWPLRNSPNTTVNGTPRANFSIGGQF